MVVKDFIIQRKVAKVVYPSYCQPMQTLSILAISRPQFGAFEISDSAALNFSWVRGSPKFPAPIKIKGVLAFCRERKPGKWLLLEIRQAAAWWGNQKNMSRKDIGEEGEFLLG